MEMTAFLLALGVMLARRYAGDTALLGLLAWLFAGIALVKDEGLLACIGGLLILACAPRSDKGEAGKRIGRQELAWCGLAAAGAYLPWFLLKLAWHLTNDVLQPGTLPRFTIGLLSWRLEYALRSIVLNLARIGPWYPCWGLLLLLSMAGAIMAWRLRVCDSVPLWLLALFQFAGYIGIYLITPYSLAWLVGSSLDRLILHVAPTLLLASLLACFGTKQEAV